MEPATKRDDQDRISQLPDPILHHILSAYFLETKHVVRTCVLSKRWRNLWASMPNLSLGDFELEDEEMNIEFLTFVNTLLLRREPLDVHSFCIYWSNDFDEHRPRHITTWTQYAVDHNVKKIQIFLLFGDLGDYEFPRCVFTCPTLEDLYLYIGGPLAVLPAVVSLGRLRKLHLECFTCRTILLSTLIYGCPVLEDLRLEYCKLEDADISSKSLKNLIINDCEFSGTRIQISVPSLQFLDVSVNDMLIQEVLLDNLSSVVEATFEIDRYYREPLNFVTPSTQSFYKLSKLRLDGWSVLENFPAVAHFLQHSPNLEMLTLKSYDRVCYKLYPTLKKWFVCSHRKIYLISQCGVENDRILELMTDFFSGKCGCFQD